MKKSIKSLTLALATILTLTQCSPNNPESTNSKMSEKAEIKVEKKVNQAIEKKVNEVKNLLENNKTIIMNETLMKEFEEAKKALNTYISQDVSKMDITQLDQLQKMFELVLKKAATVKEDKKSDSLPTVNNNNYSKPKVEKTNKNEHQSKPTVPVINETKKQVVNHQKEEVKLVNSLPEAIDEVLTTKIDAVMNEWIDNNYIPGGVVLVAKNGKIITHKAYGHLQVAEKDVNSPYHNPTYVPLTKLTKVSTNTMYDLASVTKVMATTQAVMKLVSENKLDLNEKVAKYLPGFEKNGKQDVTVKSLLTHTSGLPQWEPTYFYATNKEQQLDFIKNISLNEKFVLDGVGNKLHHYSDLGFMTLGYIVEAISNKPLDQYVQENIYQPLQLKHTTYRPLDKNFKDIAATSFGNPYEYKMVDETLYPKVGYDTSAHQEKFKMFNGWRDEVLIGKVNDGNAGMATKGVAGHAGLFSTAKDLAVIGQLMLNKGTYEGVRIYKPDIVDLFTSKQTNTNIISEEFGYAFKLDQSWMGDSASERVFGHDGFTGTYVSFDPENELQIIVLTNKMQSGFRKGTLPNGKPHNKNLYWNISSMVKNIANITRSHLEIK